MRNFLTIAFDDVALIGTGGLSNGEEVLANLLS
jgi:hypothetical protein